MPRNSQLPSEKNNINFNKTYCESIVVPDHDVNSFTTFEIKTEPKINDDDLGENDSMFTCDDVSTKFYFFKYK